MSVAIVDYGSGNLHSAAKAFERAARESGHTQPIMVTSRPDEVARADRVVLPGVGAFADCRSGLDEIHGMVEALNENVRMDNLRWTLAHVYDISPANIERARALGMTLAVHGAAMSAGVPIPMRQIADSGIVFGLGTDATIVSHYQPFVTLGWAVSGLDLAGKRVLDETLTREEALIAHTRSNAYLFSQEDNLGSLETGKQADLVVLDRDYMTVPAAEIMNIEPVMTMVGGRIVYSANGQPR